MHGAGWAGCGMRCGGLVEVGRGNGRGSGAGGGRQKGRRDGQGKESGGWEVRNADAKVEQTPVKRLVLTQVACVNEPYLHVALTHGRQQVPHPSHACTHLLLGAGGGWGSAHGRQHGAGSHGVYTDACVCIGLEKRSVHGCVFVCAFMWNRESRSISPSPLHPSCD